MNLWEKKEKAESPEAWRFRESPWLHMQFKMLVNDMHTFQMPSVQSGGIFGSDYLLKTIKSSRLDFLFLFFNKMLDWRFHTGVGVFDSVFIFVMD